MWQPSAGCAPQITEQDKQDILAYQDALDFAPRFALASWHGWTTRGDRLHFADRPWLLDMYLDRADQMVVQKSSQIGISDFAIYSTFAWARNKMAVMYVLPTDVMVFDFTPRRIDKLIEREKFFKLNCVQGRKDSDTKKQKTLFGIDCHFVGSNSANNFFEKPCDVLVIDELDLCDQANLTFAYDRLGSSKGQDGLARQVWLKLGNPSITGYGINAEYDKSDRKHWFVQCGHCGEQQVLDWWLNVVFEDEQGWHLRHDDATQGDASAVCIKCSKPIDRLGDGEWVAEYPDRKVSGYNPSKIFGDPRRGPILRSMFAEFSDSHSDQTKKQHFYNQVLGLPFKQDGAGFDVALLQRACREYDMPMTAPATVAGVDVGSRLHVHIETVKNGIRRKVFVGNVADWDELHRLSYQYHVTHGVIDGEPEHHMATEFCASHPGWYVCYYNLALEDPQPMQVEYAKRRIRTKRTPSLDESLAHYLDGRVELPRNGMGLDNGDFVTQMCTATRVEVERTVSGIIRKVYIWDDGGRPDHHQHADNYCRIAAGMYGSGENLVRVF